MPESHLPQSWLAGEVLMDPFLLREARAAYADRGGGAGGYLAARRLLDQRLRAMVHWPRARDYADLADDLAAAGRDDDAILLRRVAATRALLTEAQTRWNTRYDRRAETARDRDVRRLIQGSLIDIDPDAPYPGVDGSLYWPGYTSLHAGDQLPVIMVSGRGLRELITGFDGHPAAERWLRSRGPTATGPLTPPDVPALPRAVLEEHILARMLQAPATIPAAMTTLPPATFTTDARYDIYAAITTLARRGGSWDTGDVAAELARRADWIPGWALSHNGGHGTPWTVLYLRRLAVTDPISYAVPQLLAEDAGAHVTARGQDPAAHPGHRTAPHYPEPSAEFASRLLPGYRPPFPGPRDPGPTARM